MTGKRTVAATILRRGGLVFSRVGALLLRQTVLALGLLLLIVALQVVPLGPAGALGQALVVALAHDADLAAPGRVLMNWVSAEGGGRGAFTSLSAQVGDRVAALAQWLAAHSAERPGTPVSPLAGQALPRTALGQPVLHPLADLSLLSPAPGEWESSFGWQPAADGSEAELSEALVIRAPAGSAVVAAGGGMVGRADAEAGVVWLDHAAGVTTVYEGLAQLEVAARQRVNPGQVIGRMPADATARLHFAVWVDGRAVDPAPLLAPAPPSGL